MALAGAVVSKPTAKKTTWRWCGPEFSARERSDSSICGSRASSWPGCKAERVRRFCQPFFDFIKLLGKDTVVPRGANRRLFYALPFMSLAAMALGLVIVPAPGNAVSSFPGDIVLLLYLLEVPVLCDVMAGYVSQSIYGQVSATREAVMSLGYNLPFLAAVIAMAQKAGSFRLGDLQSAPFGLVTGLAAIAFLLAVP